MKVKVYGSSATGPMDGFADRLAERNQSVSLTVDDGFHFDDNSFYRVLHTIEPPEVLDVVDRVIKNHAYYDLILTWHSRILASCPNAVLFPQSVCTFMSYENGSLVWSPNVVDTMEVDETKKEFKASFLTSSKAWTPGHILRQEIYERLPEQVGQIAITKVKSPPWVDKKKLLDTFQFTITPQNACHENWFDDKIIDALMTKTIPLFWGCPNIGKFFNTDSILHFKSVDEMFKMLESLTPEYYQAHYSAVLDNDRRARAMVHIWSRMDKEITAGLQRKLQGIDVRDESLVLEFPKRPEGLQAKSILGERPYRPLSRS